MYLYSISCRSSGAWLGVYHGRTRGEAVEAMHRLAGYTGTKGAAAALQRSVGELCGDLDVTEAPHLARAAGKAPIHSSDSDCAGHVVDGECEACGVTHVEPCSSCGASGYHLDACALLG